MPGEPGRHGLDAAHARGSFIDAIGPAASSALHRISARRVFRAGSVLALQGERARLTLVLLSGFVKISLLSAGGREVVLGIRGPGDPVGEVAGIDGEPAAAQATALTGGEGLTIETAAFRAFLLEHADAAVSLLEVLSARVRESELRRVEFGSMDTKGRLARLLVELAERFGTPSPSGVAIDLPLSQADLAGWTGSSREAVSRALGSFRARGWISTVRRGSVVHDLDPLRALARIEETSPSSG